MITTTCDGCGGRIGGDDQHAARNIQLSTGRTDWCGPCVAIIRAELPRLAREAREARRAAAAEPVRSRAMRVFEPGALRTTRG
jgi:hypothetical protein